ncbi:Uncharacterised protein [Burkholderia pseudomallei]|nr:Uncharacterised protein [Burkholderia pseudomallei]
MNSDAPCRAPTAASRSASAAGSMRSAVAPMPSRTAGRVKSVGKSSTGGTPASCARQYSRNRATRCGVSASRCPRANAPGEAAAALHAIARPARSAWYASTISRDTTIRDHASKTI